MTTHLIKFISFLIFMWEIHKEYQAHGCSRVFDTFVGNQFLLVQSQLSLQTMEALYIFVSDGDLCTTSSSFVQELIHFLTLSLLKQTALAPHLVHVTMSESECRLWQHPHNRVWILNASLSSSWDSLNVAKSSGVWFLLCLLIHI